MDDDMVTFEFHEHSGKHSLIKNLLVERDHFNVGTLTKRLRKDNEPTIIGVLSTSQVNFGPMKLVKIE